MQDAVELIGKNQCKHVPETKKSHLGGSVENLRLLPKIQPSIIHNFNILKEKVLYAKEYFPRYSCGCLKKCFFLTTQLCILKIVKACLLIVGYAETALRLNWEGRENNVRPLYCQSTTHNSVDDDDFGEYLIQLETRFDFFQK